MNPFNDLKDRNYSQCEFNGVDPINRDTRKQTKLRLNMTSWLIIVYYDQINSNFAERRGRWKAKEILCVHRREFFEAKGISPLFYETRDKRWNRGEEKRSNGCCHRVVAISRSIASGSWKRVQQEREIFPHRLEKPTPTSRLVRPGGGGGGVEERHGGVG